MVTMRLQSSYVLLKDVRFYAYHGVLPQERRVGGWFSVTLRVGVPLQASMASDRIEDTVNYATLFELVKHEMAQPSKLLEHVAGRIAQAVADAMPVVTSLDVWLQKDNPPMGADCSGAGVELHLINDKSSGGI